MKKIQQIIKGFLFIFFFIHIQLLSEKFDFLKNSVKTWDADPPKVQLQKEGTLLPKNLGGLFIPTMSSSNIEPGFKIYKIEGNKKKLNQYLSAHFTKTTVLLTHATLTSHDGMGPLLGRPEISRN